MSLTFQPKIEIKSKHLYVLTALVLVLTGGVYFSTAYGTGDPQNVGHTIGEIGAEFDCPPGKALQKIWDNNGSAVCGELGGGTEAHYFDDPITIASGDGSGTFDVKDISKVSDDAKALLLQGRAVMDQSDDGSRDVYIKLPSHGSYKKVVWTSGTDSDQNNVNTFWYGLEDGELNYSINVDGGGNARLKIMAESTDSQGHEVGSNTEGVYTKSCTGYQCTVSCNSGDLRVGCSAYDPSTGGSANEADAKPKGDNGCQTGEEDDVTGYAYCLNTG